MTDFNNMYRYLYRPVQSLSPVSSQFMTSEHQSESELNPILSASGRFFKVIRVSCDFSS